MRYAILTSILFLSLTSTANAQGTRLFLSNIGPAISSGTAASGFELVISSAGAGVRNCLTELSVISDTAYTITIYDGGSTAAEPLFELIFASADTGITKDWPTEVALCGAKNTEMTIDITAGAFKLNHTGYTF